jgi:hypothetical protein
LGYLTCCKDKQESGVALKWEAPLRKEGLRFQPILPYLKLVIYS